MLIKTLILFLLLSGSAWATPTLVSNTAIGGNSSTETGTITTSAINTVGASLIIVQVSWYAGGTQNTPTDSASNTWIALANSQSGNGNSAIHLYYCINPITSSTHTFSETFNTGYASLGVMAFSGTSSIDKQAANNGESVASVTAGSASITPSASGELIFAGLAFDKSNPSVTINDSFIIPATLGQINWVSNEGTGIAMAYLVDTNSSAINPTFTLGTTNADVATKMVSFFASGGGRILQNARVNNANFH